MRMKTGSKLILHASKQRHKSFIHSRGKKKSTGSEIIILAGLKVNEAPKRKVAEGSSS